MTTSWPSSNIICLFSTRDSDHHRGVPAKGASTRSWIFGEGWHSPGAVCAQRLAQIRPHPLSRDEIWREALIKVLGEDALDLGALAQQRKRAVGEQAFPRGLGDFFFEPDDPLHPDK